MEDNTRLAHITMHFISDIRVHKYMIQELNTRTWVFGLANNIVENYF